MNTPVYVTIISSLISGIIGVIVSSWFYSRMEKRKLKTDTARRLFGYRYHLKGEGFTTALNEAIIIFADNKEVVKAIENMLVASSTPGKPDMDNKLISVFKSILKDVNCLPKNINDTQFLLAFNIKDQQNL